MQEPCLAPFTFASHTYPDFHLLMPLYRVPALGGHAEPLEAQALKWVRPRDLAHIRCRRPICRSFPCCAICCEPQIALDRAATTSIEYAVIASMISILILTGVSAIGSKINIYFQEMIAPFSLDRASPHSSDQ